MISNQAIFILASSEPERVLGKVMKVMLISLMHFAVVDEESNVHLLIIIDEVSGKKFQRLRQKVIDRRKAGQTAGGSGRKRRIDSLMRHALAVVEQLIAARKYAIYTHIYTHVYIYKLWREVVVVIYRRAMFRVSGRLSVTALD